MTNPPVLTQTPLVEQWHAGGFLVSEARGHRARDIGTIGGATKVYPGTVLGLQTGGVAAAWPGNPAQENNNTGNGTIALASPPIVAGAQLGVYTLTATSATNFAVTDPYGNLIGNATAAASSPPAFSNQIALSITIGSTPFVAGDEFSVEVEAIAGAYVPLNPTASDGSQTAVGIAFGFTDATLNDVPGTVVTRECEVNGSELLWPSGATAAQIAAATAQLTALGIITR
ncbi:bacteriophage lambda head decoration protein D [Paraburkholderia eburnea]|uniref:Bacteriophage lambda head decoration protein D n=1 Tax=Paraburkholderia eburnea TaxID=1189126 RepID=A0A2S4MDF2_9BURK|nr:head decoration protein [Paraburkholderia eburnea]POR52762.1 bacteriophage lambda head decoration protein D [Paraburkholderia eburnea]PRZ23630.1 bacteriophage lambda head decoration protein D [Paraburkholderia eburnea]